MNVESPNPYGELDSVQLREFETQLGCKLPSAYRKFLLKFNGAKPIPSDFKIGRGASSLHHVYGLHNGPGYCHLAATWGTLQDRIPDSLLPIADDPGGNQICIGIKGKYKGRIYFWDHEVDSDKPNFKNVRKISESFGRFTESLFEWVDPSESKIDLAVKKDDVDFVRHLIENGYNIETKDDYGRSLIENAAIHNSSNTIELLISIGARRRRQALALAELNSKEFKGYRKTLHLLRKSLPRRSK